MPQLWTAVFLLTSSLDDGLGGSGASGFMAMLKISSPVWLLAKPNAFWRTGFIIVLHGARVGPSSSPRAWTPLDVPAVPGQVGPASRICQRSSQGRGRNSVAFPLSTFFYLPADWEAHACT